MQAYAIIVDPLASGRFLPDEFAKRGIKCIGVLSAPLPPVFAPSLYRDKFEQIIDFDGDRAALAAKLRPLEPVCVMVGLETGVDLCDWLAHELGLPGNDPATSAQRRDKYEMQQGLHAKGVRAIKQKRAASIDEARAWMQDHNQYPVVVKPSNSAGSDSVHICDDEAHALEAIKSLLGATNVMGAVNNTVLLQECLKGEEWVVDTVTCNGKHVVTNVTRYLKVLSDDGHMIYRHVEFMSPLTQGVPEIAPLVEYALLVNNTLGIRYGSAHHEIMMTKDGPTLIEVNARMHGGETQVALRWTSPMTQIDLSVDAFINPESFAKKAAMEQRYSHVTVAPFLIARRGGKVTWNEDEAVLKAKLPSLRSIHMPKPGTVIEKTVSLTNAPGFAWLLNTDPDALWRDYKEMIAMEDAGLLYKIGDE